MMSESSFFKCIDESIHLRSMHSDNPIYYYHYAHQAQFSLIQSLGVPADLNMGMSI